MLAHTIFKMAARPYELMFLQFCKDRGRPHFLQADKPFAKTSNSTTLGPTPHPVKYVVTLLPSNSMISSLMQFDISGLLESRSETTAFGWSRTNFDVFHRLL